MLTLNITEEELIETNLYIQGNFTFFVHNLHISIIKKKESANVSQQLEIWTNLFMYMERKQKWQKGLLVDKSSIAMWLYRSMVRTGDNVSTIQWTEEKRDRQWVSVTVMWHPTRNPTDTPILFGEIIISPCNCFLFIFTLLQISSLVVTLGELVTELMI